MFTIEKGIPLTKAAPKRSGESKYPWREMEVGDSFLMPCDPADSPRLSRQMRVTAWRAHRLLGRDFRVRQTPDGVRIWRIA